MHGLYLNVVHFMYNTRSYNILIVCYIIIYSTDKKNWHTHIPWLEILVRTLTLLACYSPDIPELQMKLCRAVDTHCTTYTTAIVLPTIKSSGHMLYAHAHVHMEAAGPTHLHARVTQTAHIHTAVGRVLHASEHTHGTYQHQCSLEIFFLGGGAVRRISSACKTQSTSRDEVVTTFRTVLVTKYARCTSLDLSCTQALHFGAKMWNLWKQAWRYVKTLSYTRRAPKGLSAKTGLAFGPWRIWGQ